MFGGLHIKRATLHSFGTLLQESGWTAALAEAGITSSGTAESFLSAAKVDRNKPKSLAKIKYQNRTSKSNVSRQEQLLEVEIEICLKTKTTIFRVENVLSHNRTLK